MPDVFDALSKVTANLSGPHLLRFRRAGQHGNPRALSIDSKQG
jgi:hypothetical protein